MKMKNNKWSIGVGVVSCLLLIAGCSASGTYEADYTYEVMKKAADGSVKVVERENPSEPHRATLGVVTFKGLG